MLQKSIRTQQTPTINAPNGNFKNLGRVSSRLTASWADVSPAAHIHAHLHRPGGEDEEPPLRGFRSGMKVNWHWTCSVPRPLSLCVQFAHTHTHRGSWVRLDGCSGFGKSCIREVIEAAKRVCWGEEEEVGTGMIYREEGRIMQDEWEWDCD